MSEAVEPRPAVLASPASRDQQRRREPHGPTRGGFRLGRIAGVEIRIDWSLAIVFWLIIANLAMGLLPLRHPDWSAGLIWMVAVVGAVLFFASILAHEMAHALVARTRGVSIEGITLFLFGGVARMRGEPKSAGSELLIAAVGPLTSFVIGGLCIAAGMAFGRGAEPGPLSLAQLSPAASLLLWLGSTNLLLAVFNMLPGFPLDGGRVLRAALWKITGDVKRATRGASLVGRVVAFALIVLGVTMAFGVRVPFLGSGLAQGVWLVLIGWFLDNAAVNSYRQLVVTRLLANVSAARLMRGPVTAVGPQLPVNVLVDRYFMQNDQKCFPVMEGDRFAGIVCVTDLRKIGRDAWDLTPVRDIMTRSDDLISIRSDESVADALGKLTAGDVDQLPVVDAARPGTLVGMLRRSDILRYIELQGAG